MKNKKKNKKDISLQDVIHGQSEILQAIGSFSNRVEERFEGLEGRMEGLEGRISKLENEVVSLRSSVNNYLELSDKRYLELRDINRLMLKYLKLVVEKTKIPINLLELEKLVK